MKVNKIQYITLAVTIIMFLVVLYKLYSLENKINKLGIVATRSLLKNTPGQIKEVSVETDDDFSIGKDDAPVTIIMFSDYECGYCKFFFDDIFPKFQEDLIAKGVVKFVIRDYPLERHENAFLASKMVECAYKQGSFLEMHELILNNNSDISIENYQIWSSQLGLDTNSTNVCINSPEIESEIMHDINVANKAGIKGTPAFVINDKLYMGTRPYDKFIEIVMQELKAIENTCN